MRIPALLLACLIATTVSPAVAQQPGAPRPGGPPQAAPAATGREVAGPAEEKTSVTNHAMTVDGRDIKYTATTGTLPIRLDDGKVVARMFYVAYTKDGEDVGTRPVSFLFNGGPGSASIWLHMGSFGPRRVQMAADGFQPAPPYTLEPNPYSLIDVTDMVFVDAIDTGFSRGVEGASTTQFHGQSGDIRAFGEFINTYLTTFSRWPSPKFLIGESYGTIRSAGLSQELQSRHGIELNGVVLLSALLTYQTLSPAPNNDVAYAALIQTYAATAWYHKKLPADLQALPLEKVVGEARTFAFGEYMTALTRGNSLSAAERASVAQKLSRLTGISTRFIEASNLRVNSGRFRKELLRDQRLMVGRLDSRYTGVDLDSAGESQEFDPSNTALQGAYTALFQDYVRRDLKWQSDLHYPSSGNVRPWTYDQNRYMDMTEALRQAMTKNPFLKVFVIVGHYDMATPSGGIEFNMSHLAYDDSVTKRVSWGYYEGGHMMYARPSAHKILTQDLAKFIRAASGR